LLLPLKMTAPRGSFYSLHLLVRVRGGAKETRSEYVTLHICRVVIVTPSAYCGDNPAALFGMKTRGGNARGVPVIEEKPLRGSRRDH